MDITIRYEVCDRRWAGLSKDWECMRDIVRKLIIHKLERLHMPRSRLSVSFRHCNVQCSSINFNLAEEVRTLCVTRQANLDR
jgi:hypothetical protein